MNISAIYADGVSVVTSWPNYDPTKPQKNWIRTPQPGEDPTDLYEYQTAVPDSAAPNYVRWHQKGITLGEAAAANLPPADFHGNPVSGAVPIPMDPAKIPAGYTLTANFAGLMLSANVQNPPPAPSSDATLLQQIATDVAAIKAKLQA